LTQIIKTTTPGKERPYLSKAIVITIREFMRQTEPGNKTRDMIAFIILALKEITSGIEQSVAAWEKRGYWVKADKYRLEWEWTGRSGQNLEIAFNKNQWDEIAKILIEVMNQFNSIKVSDRHRMGKPWQGAYKEFVNNSSA
jgi:hypothetical protein